jgi:hypothetical protein
MGKVGRSILTGIEASEVVTLLNCKISEYSDTKTEIIRTV